jgi:hypothetical protein
VFEPSLGKVLDPISKTKPKGLGGVAPVTEHMSSNFEAQCRGKRESQSVCLYLSLSLSLQPRLALNSTSSCLRFPSAGTIGAHYHARIPECLLCHL